MRTARSAPSRPGTPPRTAPGSRSHPGHRRCRLRRQSRSGYRADRRSRCKRRQRNTRPRNAQRRRCRPSRHSVGPPRNCRHRRYTSRPPGKPGLVRCTAVPPAQRRSRRNLGSWAGHGRYGMPHTVGCNRMSRSPRPQQVSLTGRREGRHVRVRIPGCWGHAANTRRTSEIAAGPSGHAWRVCRAAEVDAGTKHGERVHEESGLVLTQSLRTPFRPRGAPCTSFQTLPSRAVSAMIPPGDAWQPHDHAGRDMTVARQHAGRGVVRLRAGHH